MTERTGTIYIAWDGTEFLSEEKCKKYESKNLLSDLDGSYFYDIEGKPIEREKIITRTIFIADLRSKKAIETFKKIQNRNGHIDVTNIDENQPDIYFYDDTDSADEGWYSIDSFLKEFEQTHSVYAMVKKMKQEKGENNND